MDVDIGKLPEPHRLSPATEPASIPTLDGWIENLMNCKQLAENDVQRLCDRVCPRDLDNMPAKTLRVPEADVSILARLGKYCKTNPMYNPWYVL